MSCNPNLKASPCSVRDTQPSLWYNAGTQHKPMAGTLRKNDGYAGRTGALSVSSATMATALAAAAAAVLVATTSGLKSDSSTTLFVGPSSTSLYRVPRWAGTRTSQQGATANCEGIRMQRSRWCERSRARRGRQEEQRVRSSLLRVGASSEDNRDVSATSERVLEQTG